MEIVEIEQGNSMEYYKLALHGENTKEEEGLNYTSCAALLYQLGSIIGGTGNENDPSESRIIYLKHISKKIKVPHYNGKEYVEDLEVILGAFILEIFYTENKCHLISICNQFLSFTIFDILDHALKKIQLYFDANLSFGESLSNMTVRYYSNCKICNNYFENRLIKDKEPLSGSSAERPGLASRETSIFTPNQTTNSQLVSIFKYYFYNASWRTESLFLEHDRKNFELIKLKIREEITHFNLISQIIKNNYVLLIEKWKKFKQDTNIPNKYFQEIYFNEKFHNVIENNINKIYNLNDYFLDLLIKNNSKDTNSIILKNLKLFGYFLKTLDDKIFKKTFQEWDEFDIMDLPKKKFGHIVSTFLEEPIELNSNIKEVISYYLDGFIFKLDLNRNINTKGIYQYVLNNIKNLESYKKLKEILLMIEQENLGAPLNIVDIYKNRFKYFLDELILKTERSKRSLDVEASPRSKEVDEIVIEKLQVNIFFSEKEEYEEFFFKNILYSFIIYNFSIEIIKKLKPSLLVKESKKRKYKEEKEEQQPPKKKPKTKCKICAKVTKFIDSNLNIPFCTESCQNIYYIKKKLVISS
jgi:hypothetical protein